MILGNFLVFGVRKNNHHVLHELYSHKIPTNAPRPLIAVKTIFSIRISHAI